MFKKVAFSMMVSVFALAVCANAQSTKTKINSGNQPHANSAPSAAQSFMAGPSSSSLSSVNQVLTHDYTVSGNSCADFFLYGRLSNASVVNIAILALDQDLSYIRLIPFFLVSGAPYFSAVDEIHGSGFRFYDQGGASVNVYGDYMIVRVCNDSSYPLRITQLTAHAVNK